MKVEELKSLLKEIRTTVEKLPESISDVSIEKNEEIQKALFRLEQSLSSVIRIQ